MVLIAENFPIAQFTTMGVPATAARYLEAASLADLEHLRLAGLLAEAVPLGGGSNMLLTAEAASRNFLHPALTEIEVTPEADGDAVTVKAGAGVIFDDLVALTCSWGLWGLENLSAIPGHVGGAAIQNAGAYGAEVADSLTAVELYDMHSGKVEVLPAAAMAYGYRTSRMKHPDMRHKLVVAAIFSLRRNGAPRLAYEALARSVPDAANLTPQQMREAVIELRSSRLPDPAEVGSVGSYFVNPTVDAAFAEKLKQEHPDAPAFPAADGRVKLSAAWLIDHAGCKPLRCGGASLWPAQPLVIVNAEGNATADDVVALEECVRRRVADTFGVPLQCEVVKI